MSKHAYHPERGDIIEMNFQPPAGREIDKRRPAIVLRNQVLRAVYAIQIFRMGLRPHRFSCAEEQWGGKPIWLILPMAFKKYLHSI